MKYLALFNAGIGGLNVVIALLNKNYHSAIGWLCMALGQIVVATRY